MVEVKLVIYILEGFASSLMRLENLTAILKQIQAILNYETMALKKKITFSIYLDRCEEYDRLKDSLSDKCQTSHISNFYWFRDDKMLYEYVLASMY